MRVDIEEIIQIKNRINEINSTNLNEIEWFRNGEQIEVGNDEKDNWRYVGLSNFYFAELNIMTNSEKNERQNS